MHEQPLYVSSHVSGKALVLHIITVKHITFFAPGGFLRVKDSLCFTNVKYFHENGHMINYFCIAVVGKLKLSFYSAWSCSTRSTPHDGSAEQSMWAHTHATTTGTSWYVVGVCSHHFSVEVPSIFPPPSASQPPWHSMAAVISISHREANEYRGMRAWWRERKQGERDGWVVLSGEERRSTLGALCVGVRCQRRAVLWGL